MSTRSLGIRLARNWPVLALMVLIFLCIAASLGDIRVAFDLNERERDFEVYYTAASMVYHHETSLIYSGADNGVDPQLRDAPKDSPIARRAASAGIDRVQFYVYPPTLAYLLLPFALMPIWWATLVWKLLCISALVATGLVLARLAGYPPLSRTGFAFCAFMLLFRPDLECLFWGQATAILALILVAGLYLIERKRVALATLLFALAFAVKLTPLITIIPLAVWREWKALRCFALWTAAIVIALWLPDRGQLLGNYVEHVLPPMSVGAAVLTNKSLDSSMRLILLAVHCPLAPKVVSYGSKFLSLFLIGLTAWRARSAPAGAGRGSPRLQWMTSFWLLSCCLSPVSWRHAYALAAPAVIALLTTSLQGKIEAGYYLLLLSFTLSVSSFGLDSFAKRGGALVTALDMLPPMLGALLALTSGGGFDDAGFTSRNRSGCK